MEFCYFPNAKLLKAMDFLYIPEWLFKNNNIVEFWDFPIWVYNRINHYVSIDKTFKEIV